MAQKELWKLYPKIEGDSNFGFGKISFIPTDTEPASPQEGQMYYDDSENKIKVYTGSAWEALDSDGGGAGTGLDGAYDINSSITVDGATLTLTGSNADVLTVVQTVNNDGIYVSKTGSGAGAGINISNAGTGADIYGTSGTWQISKAGAITATDLTLTTSTVSVTGDATDGVIMAIEADTLTTGTALEIDADGGAGVTAFDIQNASSSVFKVGGTGIVTLAGVASGTTTFAITAGDIEMTAGDINITAGDIALTSGLYSQTTDGSADGFALTDLAGQNNDLMYLNGTDCAGSGSILKIDQGAAARTGHAIDINMGLTAVAMSAIDISCTGGTRTVPIVNIDSDGTASDFISFKTDGVFTGNMINMQAATGASTGNFIFINNDTGTSMEAINIDDEANVEDVILISAAGATGAGNALINLVATGTPNATANALLVNWTGITATNTPYAVKIDTSSKDAGGLYIDTDAATDDGVVINGGGAIADNKALLDIVADGEPAAAGSNLLRVDGSGMTATNKPVLVEIDGHGKTVRGLEIDCDIVDNHVALINGGGALTDGKAVLAVTNDGNLATGGNLVNITMGGTPHAAACALEIVASKDAKALDITTSAATNSAVKITGVGAIANDMALLHVSHGTGAIVAGGSLVRIEGNANAGGATAYGMTINCDGTNLEALWVEAGTVLVAETLQATGGLSTKVGTTADLTATPTDAEFSTAFGVANKTRGGFMGVVVDSSDGKTYFVVSDGTNWQYTALTKAT